MTDENEAKVTLSDGSPVTPSYRELDPNTGQQHDYLVLSPEERARGFTRPVRTSYVHVGKNAIFNGEVLLNLGDGGCGAVTVMADSIAETYAKDPGFYDGTFCVKCKTHLPLDEFVWDGTSVPVGT